MKKHQPAYVSHLMQGCGPSSDPAAILMRGHHAAGGEAKANGGPMMPKYKRGGHVSHRRRHADGGPTDLAGTMSMQQPNPMGNVQQPNMGTANMRQPNPMPPSGNPATAMKEGGKAFGGRMARMGMEGHGIRKMPAEEHKRGGRASPRHHHFWGMLASALAPMAVQGLGKLFGMKEGGQVNTQPLKRAMGGSGKVRKGMMTEKGIEK